MATKVYQNFKSITNFLKQNHLLNAQLSIPSENQTHIPITNIKVIKTPHPKGSNSQLMVKFETFDKNSGELSSDQYQQVLQYLKELQISNGAYFKVQHHIDPLTTRDTVNYIQGIMAFPKHLIKHAFTLHKHTLYDCEFIGKNGQAIYLLLSPDLNPMWVTQLSSQGIKFNKRNLDNLLTLIQQHLINDFYAIYIKSKHTFILQMFTSYTVDTFYRILRIYYNTGNIALKLDKADIYLIDTDKQNPALKINYPKDKLTYYIILSPTFNKDLLPKLLQ